MLCSATQHKQSIRKRSSRGRAA